MRLTAASLVLALCACAAPTSPVANRSESAGNSHAAIAPRVDRGRTALPTPAPNAVPEAFRGEWNLNPEHCGSALNDSRLRIGADQIQYYESSGPIRAAVARGTRELAVIAEVSGEGETWLATDHFRLSADMNELSSDNGAGAPVVRYRCNSR
jgi:hypothetical protein